MLREFKVKNYKNFRNTLSIDFTNVHDYKYNEFCIKNGLIGKTIIYGKNAEGKSNLGMAIFDIAYDIQLNKNPYLYRNDQRLYKNATALDSELIEFFYSFQFDTDIVNYEYKKKDANETVFEKLSVNNQIIFYYDSENGEHDFSNVGKINANELNWEEFFNVSNNDAEATKPTALRYIIYNTVQKEGSIVAKLSHFIKRMRFTSSLNANMRLHAPFEEYFEEPEELEKFEKFLNAYGVKCKLIMLDQPNGKKELYFDYAKPLLFASNLSSGTLALTKFYFQYLNGTKPSFIFMDEFDAFFHYELSEKIVDLLEREFDCQVILTSHNTDLLSNSIMRPDCFMILNNGKLTPICEATTRELRQGHNLEKLYKNGEFNV
ncbi:MAG: ATP-binding protein [Clostridia bacterium]|nr:ATP-binding protein [Clostridia bacterium]